MLDNKTKAAILENMDPKKASALAALLEPAPNDGQTQSSAETTGGGNTAATNGNTGSTTATNE
jgi:flagellar motility protein MotE (MotC chaperone)